MTTTLASDALYKFSGPLLVALFALAGILATIGPDGNGPGVTCDELYHVHQGKQLVTALRQQGLAFFLPANIDRNFSWCPDGPPVQAPLGYWILGWTHYLFDPAPDDPSVLSITAARFAPAMAFAVLIFLVGSWTVFREGVWAGTIAAAAVALVPRVFGHAHLAALDMLTALFFVGAALAVTEAARSGRTWYYALAGMVWGASMLVRLHGFLLAPPVLAWLFWRLYRQQKLTGGSPWTWGKMWLPLIKTSAVWMAAGGATLLLGWPWLWSDTFAHLQQYLATGISRQPLHVFYAGRVWADHVVPRHYPWVMFVVTMPAGLLVLGLLGVGATLRTTKEAETLVVSMILFVLLVFSWPGSHVYDGVRLFLMVFPLWAIFVGIGAQWMIGGGDCEATSVQPPTDVPSAAQCHGFGMVAKLFSRRKPRIAAVLVLVALQGVGLLIYHPCHLSHYGLLVGGLPGAERLGFETTYWGDAVREPLLAEAARRSPGEPVLFVPNLASFQAAAVEISSPSLHAAGVHLIGWSAAEPEAADRCRYAVVYHRRADMAAVASLLKQGRVVAEHQNQGVWLARLIELDASRRTPTRQTE